MQKSVKYFTEIPRIKEVRGPMAWDPSLLFYLGLSTFYFLSKFEMGIE